VQLAAEPLSASMAKPLGRGRILLAEDNEINILLACTILEEAGFSVVCAVNGQEAVDAVRREAFDLILMDVQMPVMDGLEATRAIRRLSGPASRSVIVAMTANAMRSDQDNCLAAGMDDFIAKPIDPNSFIAVISNLLPLQPAAPTPEPEPAPAPEILDVDEEQLDALARLLPRLKFCAVLESYLTTGKSRLERIQALSVQCDFVGLARESHDLKSTSGSFGARRLQHLAQDLEEACARRDGVAVVRLAGEIGDAAAIAWPMIGRRLRRED
jgi:CheY-like chemotaxis protein